MADRYLLQRAFGEANEITAAEARRYFDASNADPNADPSGDLETGFHFFATDDDGLQLVRWHITPLPD